MNQLTPLAGAPQLWIVIVRPDNLPNALAAADALAGRFPGGCRLLLQQSVWWQRTQWEKFRARFSAVHEFPRIETCRGLVDLPRLYRETAARQRALARLPLASERDLLIGLAGATGLTNAAASAHPAARKILCVPKAHYDELTRPVDRRRFRFTTSGWLQNRFIEPLAGVERTLHLKPRFNRGGDGVRLTRLVKPPEAVYQAIVILSNTGRELPEPAPSRLLPARFPSLADLREELLAPDGEGDNSNASNGRGRVVFFGTPFLLVKNLTPAVYIEHLNRCLDYLRRNHPGGDFIYRPHPAETGESARLQLDGFRVENDREAAELYFLRHFRDIEAVYSVSSTVSRVALNYGLNAYSLWCCFPFSSTARAFFENVMGAVPAEFDIRDLAAPPIAYAGQHQQADLGPSFAEGLNAALAATAPAGK